jgi:5-methylcytosine-specific restriction endonuclease McrA
VITSGRKYLSDRPCLHGHVGWRWLGNRGCVECHRDGVNKFRRENPEVRKRQEAARKSSDPEGWKARRQEEHARWKARHPDRVAEIRRRASRKWHASHPELSRAKHKEFHRANPHKNAEYHSKRRSLESGADGKHTAADLRSLADRQRHRCAFCGVKLTKGRRAVDHIIPISRGGSNVPSNLQWLCFSCNSRKKDRDQHVFARELGLLL